MEELAEKTHTEIEAEIKAALGEVEVNFWRKPAYGQRSITVKGKGLDWEFEYDAKSLVGVNSPMTRDEAIAKLISSK